MKASIQVYNFNVVTKRDFSESEYTVNTFTFIIIIVIVIIMIIIITAIYQDYLMLNFLIRLLLLKKGAIQLASEFGWTSVSEIREKF